MCFIILPVHRNSWCCEEFVDAERCYVVMEKFEAMLGSRVFVWSCHCLIYCKVSDFTYRFGNSQAFFGNRMKRDYLERCAKNRLKHMAEWNQALWTESNGDSPHAMPGWTDKQHGLQHIEAMEMRLIRNIENWPLEGPKDFVKVTQHSDTVEWLQVQHLTWLHWFLFTLV